MLLTQSDLARRNRYGDNALMMASLGSLLLVKAYVSGCPVKLPGWTPLRTLHLGSAPVVSYLIGRAQEDAIAPNGYRR